MNAIAFSPDSKFLAAGTADGSIPIFNVTKDKEEKTLGMHKGAVNSLFYIGKGETLLAASADKTVQLWDVAKNVSLKKFDFSGPVEMLSVSKDGSYFVAAAGQNVKTRRLDGKQGGVNLGILPTCAA